MDVTGFVGNFIYSGKYLHYPFHLNEDAVETEGSWVNGPSQKLHLALTDEIEVSAQNSRNTLGRLSAPPLQIVGSEHPQNDPSP